MIGAFAYLILTSTRNRLSSQLKRVRNPRYAVAFLLGLAYFGWFVFFNRPARGGPPPGPLVSEMLGALLPIVILLIVAYAWIFGADRTALAFTEAEVSLLFPAPVSRRGLIIYKLVRAQTAVLLTSLLWTVLLRRGFGLERALSYWVLLSTISMHRLGVALIRASQTAHGARGARRSWPRTNRTAKRTRSASCTSAIPCPGSLAIAAARIQARSSS